MPVMCGITETGKLAALGLICLVLATLSPAAEGLSCPTNCNKKYCKKLECCNSGFKTFDACGCCEVCTKGPGETCGGPFRISGICSPGLNCLKTCDEKECKGFHNGEEKSCIFPFKYWGRTYDKCAKMPYRGDLTWCAVKEVRSSGLVTSRDLGECSDGCPGVGNPSVRCDEDDYIQMEGQCVIFSPYTSSGYSGFMAKSDRGFGTPIRTCGEDSDESLIGPDPESEKFCTCAPSTRTNPGCNHASWCFLANIHDRVKPNRYCYDDVRFSTTHGRFWSRTACRAIP